MLAFLVNKMFTDRFNAVDIFSSSHSKPNKISTTRGIRIFRSKLNIQYIADRRTLFGFGL